MAYDIYGEKLASGHCEVHPWGWNDGKNKRINQYNKKTKYKIMEILYFISLGIFLFYILLILIKFGIPKSISESAYLFGRNGHIIFYSAFMAFILPLLAYWIEITNGQSSQFLVFLSCAGLCFTGITGRFKGDEGNMPKNTHIWGTMVAAIISQIWIWITFPQGWIASLILFIFAIGIGWGLNGAYRPIYHNYDIKLEKQLKYNNPIKRDGNSIIFWLEMALFAITYLAIFIYGML